MKKAILVQRRPHKPLKKMMSKNNLQMKEAGLRPAFLFYANW